MAHLVATPGLRVGPGRGGNRKILSLAIETSVFNSQFSLTLLQRELQRMVFDIDIWKQSSRTPQLDKTRTPGPCSEGVSPTVLMAKVVLLQYLLLKL